MNTKEGKNRYGASPLYIIPAILGFMLIIDTFFWNWFPFEVQAEFFGWQLGTAHLGVLILLYTTWRVLTWHLGEE